MLSSKLCIRSRCKYLETKAEMFISCLIFIYWCRTQMCSVKSKNKGIPSNTFGGECKFRFWSNICFHLSLFRDVPASFSKTMASLILHKLQQHGFTIQRSVLNGPTCSLNLSHTAKFMVHYETQNMTMETSQLFVELGFVLLILMYIFARKLV